MTVQESYQIVYMIHTAYPSDSKSTAEELAERINLYAVFFADYPAETVRTAAQGWIKYNKWMPTVHDLKAGCDMLLRLGKNLLNAKEIGKNPANDPVIEQYLEDLCKFVGLGYPNEIEGNN